MREDDKIRCAGSNVVAREIRLYTSGAMIRVSFAMVKQASVWGHREREHSILVSVEASPGSAECRSYPSSLSAPEIVQKPHRRPRPDPAELDALLVIVPDEPEKELFRQLPESERWQELNARAPSRAPERCAPPS